MTTATARRRTKKKGQRPRRLDPVSAYARDVLSGTIVAGRAVRLAARRHVTNLEQQRTAAFPYYFDRRAAEHIINFFPRFLTLEDGRPFVLPPWLQFGYGSIYGWKCWDGRGADGRIRVRLDPEHVERVDLRRFQHGFFETSKGSGKTPSAGGVLLYGLAYDEEPSAEIYSTGFDKGQASIILNDAIRMGEFEPDIDDPRCQDILDFKAEFIIDKYNIAHPSSGSFARAMSSQHQSKSGPRPHYVLSDEIHEHRDGTVVGKAEAGFKNRLQPLGLKYTNSGADKTSYCWQLHQKSLAVLEGTQPDEQWFAYVCHLDPCEKHFGEGYRQPMDGCAQCDDWTDSAVWPKIAPALGIVIQPKYLRDRIEKAMSVPSEHAMVRRLNFCIWTETHQVWITSDKWEACKREAPASTNNDEYLPCAAGLDPASVLDTASFVVALRHDDPPDKAKDAVDVEIEGMDEEGQKIRLAYTLNFHVELVPFFWIPKETMIERIRTERIPYDVWERAGLIFPTPGGAIDHNAIYDFIIKDAWKRFRIQRLGMDENHGRYLFMRLRDDGRLGKQIVSVGQAKKLSEAFKFIEILVAHRRLWHDGHLVLASHVANAEPQRDRLGALWIEKPSETKRIDGAVAAAMAIKELMVLPAKRKRAFGAFIA